MARNRIQIVNWRRHGDDESYNRIEAFAANETETVQELIELDEGVVKEEEYDGESGHQIYYVNDDTTIEDGEIMQSGDKKFRIRIEEVD